MGLRLTNPVLVARTGNTSLLASNDVFDNPNTNAQTWSADDGYSDVKPLQVWLKFLYHIEEVNPPEPWMDPS